MKYVVYNNLYPQKVCDTRQEAHDYIDAERDK